MYVGDLQTGMSGMTLSGMGVSCTRSSSFSKSKSGKKSLSYNPKEISSQIMRAKKAVGASQVLSRARAKLAMLKRAQATGEYDLAELENAIAHAKRMIDCAGMKVKNLREEDRLRKKAQETAEREQEQFENAKRLDPTCCRSSTTTRSPLWPTTWLRRAVPSAWTPPRPAIP